MGFKIKFNHIINVARKQLKISIRDKMVLMVGLIVPVILMGIYTLSMRSMVRGSYYTIGFVNHDMEGVSNDPALNLSSKASIDLKYILKTLESPDSIGNRELFRIYEEENQAILTEQRGKELCDLGQIDAVIIIPKNFSETIIGTTWWYRAFKNMNWTLFSQYNQTYGDNITINDEEFNVTQMFFDYMAANGIEYDEYYANLLLGILNETNFPLEGHPELDIYINPDIVTRTIITTTVREVTNSMILEYNGLKFLNMTVINRNDIGVRTLSVSDVFMPKFVIILMFFFISSVAFQMQKEKEEDTLTMLNRTYLTKTENILGIITSQLVIALIQASALILLVIISGSYLSSTINFLALFTSLFLTALISINLGIIIGNITEHNSTAQAASFITIILLQIMSGAYIFIDKNVGRLFPSYWAVRLSFSIMIDGLSFVNLFPNFIILTAFSAVTLILALSSTHFWSSSKRN